MDKQREVEYIRGKKWAASKGMKYFEVSAKTGQGINLLFEHCIQKMFHRFQHQRRKSSKEIKLEKRVVPKNQSSGCC